MFRDITWERKSQCIIMLCEYIFKWTLLSMMMFNPDFFPQQHSNELQSESFDISFILAAVAIICFDFHADGWSTCSLQVWSFKCTWSDLKIYAQWCAPYQHKITLKTVLLYFFWRSLAEDTKKFATWHDRMNESA